MSYEPRDLLDQLNADFEFDRTKAFEFGWCNILEAEDRDFHHPVWLYYPRADIWANSAARKSLTKQMTAYHDMPDNRTLPLSTDLLTGKAAAGAIVLITARSPDSNVIQKEREETGVDWATRDTFQFPDKLGAMRRFVEGYALLHKFGMVHGSVGFQTLSIRDQAGAPQFLVDFLNFSESGDKLPTASIFAEPAFSPPEVLAPADGKLVYTTRTDVYSLAKFLLYALLGPKAFLTFFLSTESAPLDDSNEDQLFDSVLWANSSTMTPENGVQRLQSLSSNRISNELAELLNRSVSVDPDHRPHDAAMFYEGLRSVMTGTASTDTGSAAPFHMPTPDTPRSKTPLFVAGGVVFALLLGGGGFLLKQRADQQNLDARIAATTRICQGFLNRVTNSRETALTEFASWPDIEQLQERVLANGADPARLSATRGFCEDGSERVVNMQGQLVTDLRTQIDDESAFATANGTDLEPVRIDAQRAAADAFQETGDFPGTAGALTALVDGIVAAHDVQINGLLDQARDALLAVDATIAPNTLNEQAVALLDSVADLAAQPASSDAVRAKNQMILDLNTTAAGELKRAMDARVATIAQMRSELLALGADHPDTGFSSLFAEYDDMLSTEADPVSVDEYAVRYASLDIVIVRLESLKAIAARREAESAQLSVQIEAQTALIDDYSWEDEGSLPTTLERWDEFEPVNTFTDYDTLSAINSALAGEITTLDAEWTQGRATCQAMFDTVTSINGLDDTAAWAGLSRIMADVRRFDTPRATREDFARCAEAGPLVEQGRIELRMNDLLAEVAQARAEVENAGAGNFIPEYASATAAHETLMNAAMPRDEASYAPVSAQAMTLIGQFDQAGEIATRARRENGRLNGELARIETLIAASELPTHPAYAELLATLAPVDAADNVILRNTALTGNVAALNELLRAFEAGELLECTFNGFEMTAVAISAGGVDAALSALSGGASFATPVALEEGASIRACLSLQPVTAAQLQDYKNTLRARDYEITQEIDATQATEDGTATNLSYWLAERYAGFIGDGADMPVCVAPALATTWAGANPPEGFTSTAARELTSDACTGDNVVSQNVALSGVGAGQATASCAPVNSRDAQTSFRLAAGDLCQ